MSRGWWARWARGAIVGAMVLAAAPAESTPPGVFVLGIDGVDPVILQRLVDEGRMPHFARLVQEGDFRELGTSYPPQSPVAWSNFVTGMNPGGHGIYDFLHRDPKTYLPIDSAVPPAGDPPPYLSLFGYIVPLPWGGGELVNNRSGTPWWDVLAAAGVDVEVYRMPGNFPPTESSALTLSGMGTVDVRGTAGTYTWYTTDTRALALADLKADLYVVSLDDEDRDGIDDTARTELKGGPDALHLPPGKHPRDADYLTVPLVVHVDPVADAVWLDLGEGQAQTIIEVGEWSDWMAVSFGGTANLLSGTTIAGQVRFYLKEVRPHLRLYASPVNIDPAAPVMPVTTPDDATEMLFEELGPFYTQGMPEETNALKDRLFDDDDYLSQVALVHADGRAMLDLALSRFERGDATFVYLSDIDLQCHMLWRHDDPKDPDAPVHPAYEPAVSPRYAGVLERFYEGIDAALGRVRAALPADTLLIVMSDHGFQAQTRRVNLNDWLVAQGYLVLQEGKTEGPLAHTADWSRTRAYGVGFNGLYLNLVGREAKGIVDPSEAEALADEIIGRLAQLTDADRGGARVVLRADKAADVYSGTRVADAPDVVVGYDKGYGCSNESTLGAVTGGPVLVDNDTSSGKLDFTGNHLMAPEVVPGVVLSNRPIAPGEHDLTDLTATLLDHYGIPPAAGMVGRTIFGFGR